jgi:hypothetical protein
MSEELQLLEKIGLSLVLCDGQWYCGRFGGEYDGDEGYVGDRYNRCVDGVLRDDGVADTIPEAIALAVTAHKNMRQQSKN